MLSKDKHNCINRVMLSGTILRYGGKLARQYQSCIKDHGGPCAEFSYGTERLLQVESDWDSNDFRFTDFYFIRAHHGV